MGKEVPGVVAVSPEVRSGAQIMAGNNNWSTSVMGESVDYLTIRQWDLADGTMFSDADVRSAAKVCILGKTVADNLFPDEDPIGKTIRIRNVPVKVLGVLRPKGASMFGSDQDDVIIVPYTTGMKRFAGVTMLRSINVQAATAEQITRGAEWHRRPAPPAPSHPAGPRRRLHPAQPAGNRRNP